MKNIKKTLYFTFLIIFMAQAAVAAQELDTQKTEIHSTSTAVNPEPTINSFTGLIIDARNLGLETTFSPVIYDETGKPIYGIKEIDTSLAITQGMVDYAPTPDLVQEAENGKSRAGHQPLNIKAIGLRDNNHNVIINQPDADKILAANQSTGFLSKCAVVFLN